MKRIYLLACCAVLCVSAHASAQEPQPSPAGEEHAWLQKFVGEWETRSEALGDDGKPTFTCQGTIRARSIGKLWVVCDMKSEIGDTQMIGMLTLGYDPQAKSYTGTWIDSIFNHLWKYEGSVDKTGKIITLKATGPNFLTEGKTAKFQDVYEFKSDDEIVISSAMVGEDGKLITFMRGVAKRKK